MFGLKIYDLGNSREYEFAYLGYRGAKGEKRAPRRKMTAEAQQRINQRNKEKYVRRLIALNFNPGDLWITLKYPRGTRKSVTAVKKDWSAFTRRMRSVYKKLNTPFKFIYRIEVGSLGGIHIHLVANAIPGQDTGMLAGGCWQRARNRDEGREAPGWNDGCVDVEYLYGDGQYEDLAKYVTKPAESDDGQMYFEGMGMEDKKAFMHFSSSRNLRRPIPEVRKYTHWTMRRILDEGVKPKEGYYIDKDSVRMGINPYTGWSYLEYREIRIRHGGNKIIRVHGCPEEPPGGVQGAVRTAVCKGRAV